MRAPRAREAALPRANSEFDSRFIYGSAAALHDPRLGHAAYRLLEELYLQARPKGFCWASREQLGAALHVSKWTITRRLQELERLGLVTVIRRHRGPERTNLCFVPWVIRSLRSQRSQQPQPRSREAVQAACLKLEIPFQERYVRKGREHPGVDEEAWFGAQKLKDADWSPEDLVAFLEKNLAAQGRSPEAVAAAARRRAS